MIFTQCFKTVDSFSCFVVLNMAWTLQWFLRLGPEIRFYSARRFSDAVSLFVNSAMIAQGE